MNEADFDAHSPTIYSSPNERHKATNQHQVLNAFVAPEKTGDESEQEPCSITPWSQESVESFQFGHGCEEIEKGGGGGVEDSDDDDIEIIGIVQGNPSQQTHSQNQVQTNFSDSSRHQLTRSEHSGFSYQSNLKVQADGGQPGYSSSVGSHGYTNHPQRPHPPQERRQIQFLTPYRIYLENHQPTWENLWPKLEIANPAPLINTTNQMRAYKLSLLSHTEFTVTAVMHHTNRYDFIPSLTGLRKPIKEITRVHAREGEKAILEEGKWRVPLSVYQIFYGYLCNQSNTEVEGIPASQLNIASIGRAVAERGYPSPEYLVDSGIPPDLAYSLAPYQRGGVDFVLQRGGKALIADEMGLGKTVQSISAMACYESEWPLLVLSPSTARYHWEAEFLNWLGNKKDGRDSMKAESDENYHLGSTDDAALALSQHTYSKRKQCDEKEMNSAKRKRCPTMRLLEPCEINVMSSSNDCILKPNTRVAILSYGLVANLIKKNVLFPGLFKCVIVDESHMLKNKKSKRTTYVMPILKGANRIIMLSGTPAFSKPKELFPQLNALGEGNGWWDDEEDFNAKYANDRYSDPSFAELHTLLTATVMIRRLKKDILRDMPHKIRENVFVKVRDASMGQQIAEGLLILRDGKGVLGKLSLLYQDLNEYHNPRMPGASEECGQNVNNDACQEDINRDVNDAESRKAILNKLFHLTGTAKIPIIIDMLKQWIDDPRNGKLCIFAHHMNVLDALIEEGGLSNHQGSSSKYIRIDGSTHPKVRQEQITRFQCDPSVRIAVLGITAAGVGVTLTAASTIWFAELFWTPAIMIQAEDRCHRIGQQAQVKCLYITAKDTLDEVLWILLKRKFCALGEFVEGKEKLDMVIHKTYANEFDVVAGKYETNTDLDFDKNDKKNAAYELVNENDIQHDIEELACDDLKQSIALDDDYAIEDVILDDDRENFSCQKEEDHIICLSDDEGDEKVSNDSPYSESIWCDELLNCLRVTQNFENLKIHGTTKFRNAQFFYAFFHSPKYCTIFSQYFGRFFVHTDYGAFQIGDMVVGLNQWVLRNGEDYNVVLNYLAQASLENPIRICFCRDESFSVLIRDWFDYRLRMLSSHRASTQTALENDQVKRFDDESNVICLPDE